MFTHVTLLLFSMPESLGLLASGIGLIAAAGSIRWALGRESKNDK